MPGPPGIGSLPKNAKEPGGLSQILPPCPIHLQPAFATLGFGPGRFPHVEHACARVLSMPFFPEMTYEQVRYAGRQLADVSGGA
ncbi:MAG: DegT/DnrJ/EryC1/StrS family aminotransferase [Terriglobia bacterium]|jgi:dTDP-4-amino-4,6-dideoxygalactose transaminase